MAPLHSAYKGLDKITLVSELLILFLRLIASGGKIMELGDPLDIEHKEQGLPKLFKVWTQVMSIIWK